MMSGAISCIGTLLLNFIPSLLLLSLLLRLLPSFLPRLLLGSPMSLLSRGYYVYRFVYWVAFSSFNAGVWGDDPGGRRKCHTR